MAEPFIVVMDLQSEGTTGTEGTKSGTKIRKGELLPSFEAVNGFFVSQPSGGRLCKLEAESAEEAVKIAREAYGPNVSGVAAVAKSTNVEFKSS